MTQFYVITQWHHNVIKQLLATNQPASSNLPWKVVGNTDLDFITPLITYRLYSFVIRE